MAKGYMSNRGVDYFKPTKFQDYLTLGELETVTGKDRSWIRKLEREGRLPKAKRHKIGALKIRLYSKEDVEFIQQYFKDTKPGRKPKKKKVE